MDGRGRYTRTPLTEARRRLRYCETAYERLLEKNRKAEADYRQKLSYLEDHVTELEEQESK